MLKKIKKRALKVRKGLSNKLETFKMQLMGWLLKKVDPYNSPACLKLLRSHSFLNKIGWFESFYESKAINKKGDAIPWYSYSAIDLLDKRIKENMTVFEYGSGNSTIWWASRVKRLVSCEHDPQWYARIKSVVPNNVEYIFAELEPSGNYSKVLLEYKKEFDLIIIDGRNRVDCAKNCLSSINNTGVIVWDDADRESYRDGRQFLEDRGFMRLDLIGLGPIVVNSHCTSIFYRADNCLEI